MFLIGVLAGAKAASHTATTVRLDPALISAFGLPGCADQSSIAQTLNAATEQDVADLQAVLGELFGSYSQARRHDFTHEILVLDIDLSPLPARSEAWGSERGYMGRSRSRDRAQTGAGTRRRHPGDRVGNGHHRSQGGELSRLARSDLWDGGPTRLGWRRCRYPQEMRTNRDPPGQWLEAEGQWTQYHLALTARVPGYEQVQIRRSVSHVGAWHQHLATYL